MELVLGITGELQPGPYVDCPEEGCVYTLEHDVLMRHQRDTGLVIREKALAVDPELDALEQERPRLRRIARMLAESAVTARLASPFVVFVPREGDPATKGIGKGSGIVGAPLPGTDRVVVDYEGAIYEQAGMARLADRVFYAHGRLVERYPTVARITVPPRLAGRGRHLRPRRRNDCARRRGGRSGACVVARPRAARPCRARPQRQRPLMSAHAGAAVALGSWSD